MFKKSSATRGVRCLKQIRARWASHGIRRFESAPTSSLRQPHHAVARSQHPDREFPYGVCCESVVGGCSRSGRWHRARTWFGRHQMGSRGHQAGARMTDRPFGVNLPIAFVREPKDRRHAGRRERSLRDDFGRLPSAYTAILKSAGLRVLHVVTSLDTAKEAVDAGVDGLIVEGIEGAGLRGKSEVSTMVLLPLIAQKVDIPLIAAGGIADGASMAAAFALGAEGVQMGTRMLASSKQMCMTASKRRYFGRQRPTRS